MLNLKNISEFSSVKSSLLNIFSTASHTSQPNDDQTMIDSIRMDKNFKLIIKVNSSLFKKVSTHYYILSIRLWAFDDSHLKEYSR